MNTHTYAHSRQSYYFLLKMFYFFINKFLLKNRCRKLRMFFDIGSKIPDKKRYIYKSNL